MATAQFRPDYAKFLFNLPRGLFATYYQRINAASHEVKFHGDWLKSHKVTALPCQNPDYENTVLESWGEWSGVVRSMPFQLWASALRRFDVRAVVWDADGDAVLATGQRLQRADVGYNVEVFNSKPASKRMGRDRGGKGFRIGSRKSDQCCVVYKRSGEPVAMEHRVQGQVLRNCATHVITRMAQQGETIDLWQWFIDECVAKGQRRLEVCLDRAGIGSYWPVYKKEGRDDYDQLQTSFVAAAPQNAEQEHWDWYEAHYGHSDDIDTSA